MFYVLCPDCGTKVEIPANAVGPDRTDIWNVVACDNCDLAFDYPDEDVQSGPDLREPL